MAIAIDSTTPLRRRQSDAERMQPFAWRKSAVGATRCSSHHNRPGDLMAHRAGARDSPTAARREGPLDLAQQVRYC